MTSRDWLPCYEVVAAVLLVKITSSHSFLKRRVNRKKMKMMTDLAILLKLDKMVTTTKRMQVLDTLK